MNEEADTKPAAGLGEPGEHPLSVLLFSWMRSAHFDRLFLAIVAAACAVAFALEFLTPRQTYSTLESVPGFFAGFGFAAFGLAALSGWPLGRLMRRREDYYEDKKREGGDDD
ncbi:MAG: hypothetical protein SGJ21_17205 [Alphaproteobacteria bacterium]|nr:hypothetical protein [Alphaproteobacteria bacterium]